MTRKEISKENVEKISNLSVLYVAEVYKEICAGIECNDGKAKITLWEG